MERTIITSYKDTPDKKRKREIFWHSRINIAWIVANATGPVFSRFHLFLLGNFIGISNSITESAYVDNSKYYDLLVQGAKRYLRFPHRPFSDQI